MTIARHATQRAAVMEISLNYTCRCYYYVLRLNNAVNAITTANNRIAAKFHTISIFYVGQLDKADNCRTTQVYQPPRISLYPRSSATIREDFIVRITRAVVSQVGSVRAVAVFVGADLTSRLVECHVMKNWIENCTSSKVEKKVQNIY